MAEAGAVDQKTRADRLALTLRQIVSAGIPLPTSESSYQRRLEAVMACAQIALRKDIRLVDGDEFPMCVGDGETVTFDGQLGELVETCPTCDGTGGTPG